MNLIQGGLGKTITGGDIENGQILIDGSKIVAVGRNLDVPAGTEIIDAAGVSEGDNMFLMNKYSAAERIRKALPYIETVQFRRSLPDGLSIIVTECADPAAIVQDGKAYLLCDTGNIVD